MLITIRLCLEISCFNQWKAELFSYVISLVNRYPRLMTGICQMIDRSYQVIDRSYQIPFQNLNLSSLHEKTNPLQIVRSSIFNHTECQSGMQNNHFQSKDWVH